MRALLAGATLLAIGLLPHASQAQQFRDLKPSPPLAVSAASTIRS